MTTMWNTNTVTIGDLLGQIKDSELALPKFQRLSVWGKADWVPFLTTILRDRPTGTLLLLETGSNNQDFSPREIDGAPPPRPKDLKWLLLDGQQRSTTLFHAFEIGFKARNDNRNEFVLDVRSALERGYLEESDLNLVSAKKVGAPAELAMKGKIALKTLIDQTHLLGWQVAYAKAFYDDLDTGLQQLPVELAQAIPGFLSVDGYKFPVLEIKQSTPLDVVVDIFEGMNRRGQRLNQFDLMAAKLYQKLPNGEYYDLREEFDSTLDNANNLKHLGVDEKDGMLPLQLISMQLARLQEPLRPAKLKGLNNKDVLELPPAQIIGLKELNPVIPNLSLPVAVEALEQAAKFLRKQCGVQGPQLLPQLSMLLPLADQFLLSKARRLTDGQMKKWFFSVGLAVDYYGSVNSYAERDCKALMKWAENPSETPPSISAVNKAYVDSLDLQQQMTREGDILGKTIMAMLVSRGALDWTKDPTAIADLEESTDFHHMVAEKILKGMLKNKDNLRPIANMTPVSSRRNSAMRDQSPTQVKAGLDTDASQISKSHEMDLALWQVADSDTKTFAAFLEDRERRLKQMIVGVLGL